MSRHTPTIAEQEAIDLLVLAGFAVLRERSYNALRERVRIAEARADMAREHRESSERWAYNCLAEERRLTYRLNEVCFAAAALGVPIDAINKALSATKEQP